MPHYEPAAAEALACVEAADRRERRMEKLLAELNARLANLARE